MIRMTFKNAEKNSHIYSGGRQVGGCMRLEETVCVAPIKRNMFRRTSCMVFCAGEKRKGYI